MILWGGGRRERRGEWETALLFDTNTVQLLPLSSSLAEKRAGDQMC